jgi:hypothetical protein
VAGAVFPLLAVVILVAHELARDPEPDTLREWVAELDRSEVERKDRATEELLRRAEADPQAVIEALVDGMRREAAEADVPGEDVRLVLAAPDGDGFETPPLPIGIWIFGERTLVGDGERLELKVVPVEAWRSFAAAHAGRMLAFETRGEVAALHRLTVDEPETLVLRSVGVHAGLEHVFRHHRFFHAGYTEPGRVLALLGPEVRPALEALAAEGPDEAHVAAWAWWRLDRNEAEAAPGR